MGAAEEPASFDDRFDELFRLAMGPAWRLLGDRHEAENVAGEVLARALVRWRRLGRDPRLPGWIATVSTNLAIAHLRKTRRPPARMAPPRPPPSVDDRLDLNDALLTLPKRQREAISLRYYLDLSEADIAGALGISVSSVKTHLQRGLTGLRRQLEEPAEAAIAIE